MLFTKKKIYAISNILYINDFLLTGLFLPSVPKVGGMVMLYSQSQQVDTIIPNSRQSPFLFYMTAGDNFSAGRSSNFDLKQPRQYP